MHVSIRTTGVSGVPSWKVSYDPSDGKLSVYDRTSGVYLLMSPDEAVGLCDKVADTVADAVVFQNAKIQVRADDTAVALILSQTREAASDE